MAFLRSAMDYVNRLYQTERRIEELPIQNRHIMGVTSLWFLIPIAYGLSLDNLSKRHYGTIALAVALLILVGVSTLFFANAKENSWLHKADIGMFTVCVVLMIILSFLPGRTVEHVLLGAIALFCVVLHALSSTFFKMAYDELQLWAHLNYRYVAYLWVHLTMVPTEASFVGYVVITVAYFAHVVLIYHVMDWSATSIQQELYWISCVLLLCWVYFTANIHALLSYS